MVEAPPGHIIIDRRRHSVDKDVRVRVRTRRSWMADGRHNNRCREMRGGKRGDHVTVGPGVEVNDDVGAL
jgi:hypothetical protein